MDKNKLPLGMKRSAIGVLLFIVVMTGLAFCSGERSNHQSSVPYLKDSASMDTPVETLKTLTAEISAVEQQNQQLIEQNKKLNEQDKKTLAQFKNEVLADVQKQIQHWQVENTARAETAKKARDDELSPRAVFSTPSARRNNGQLNPEMMPTHDEHLTWVDDLQASNQIVQEHAGDFPRMPSLALDSHQAENLSNDGISDNAIPKIIGTEKVVPFATIPVNATLTGAVALQPLIGRVPIDGKVPDPYAFKVVIGSKNLAANGIDIPAEIQGIVASGIATGDMLGRCVRGDITAMTFIFPDGRISTTQAKNGESLGLIASENGNPCLAGNFHSNAGIYLGAQAALAGLQGYGNALSQAQLSHTVSPGSGASFSQLMGSANQYALGQGVSSASQSTSRWWDQRVQNSFDFIVVPNVDRKTGKKLMLAINITQAITIDYDPQGRKLFYAPQATEHAVALD